MTGDWDGAVPFGYEQTCKGIVSHRKGSANSAPGLEDNGGYGFHISFGKDQPHNNLMPLYGVYRFRRTS